MGANRRRMKGHCMNCACQAGRVRGQGWAERAHLAEKRLVGRGRRVVRSEVPADQFADDLVWRPRVVEGRAVLWTDYEFPGRESVEMLPAPGHLPVDCAPRYDTEGWRLFEGPCEVCWACSDFESGRLVPVSFCALAMAVEMENW